MLDADTKRRIDTARDILVGKVPDPKSQVEQITIALIYKFMDDVDVESEEEWGGTRTFFAGEFAGYSWARLMRSGLGGHETLNLYAEAVTRMPENPSIPPLFRDIFKNAFLPYRDPETLRAFLKVIDEFTYDHSERLGDAFEYLLSVLGSQGDAGQFRTPRHVIDFIVAVIDPKKDETILDPACGTAGFLISSYKHILKANADGAGHSTLTPDDRGRLAASFKGYDISPDMVRLSLVNMYLHGFVNPRIAEYDTLTSEDKWNEYADVILANPPFMSPKGGIRPHSRFSVQSRRSEVLFVDYMAEHLTPAGRAGIIVPEGIMFQSQNAYRQLRKMLVEDYLVAVVSLPAGVFQPYSGVKTSILLLDKVLAKKTDRIAFFKVENDGLDLGAQRRPIDRNDLPGVQTEIAEYLRRLRTRESLDDFVPTLGRVVAKKKIAASGDYNLSGERYRESETRNYCFPLVAIGDVKFFRVESGGTPKSGIAEYWNDGVPWVTLVDLPPSDFITEIRATQRTISELGLDKSSAKLIPENSVVVSTRATIGRIGINRIPLATNQGFKNIIIKTPGLVMPEYVALALTKLVSTMETWASGGTFKEISKSKFCELQIPLPPLEVQREIVAEIEGYQRVLAGARAVVENYRPHIAVDPEWPLVALGQIAKNIKAGFACGNGSLGTEGVPHVRPMNITEGGQFTWHGLKRISKEDYLGKEDYTLLSGDVLFNNTNSKELVGKTCLIVEHINGGYSNHMTRIRVAEERYDPTFLAYVLHAAWRKGAFFERANKWIGQAGINTKSLSEFQIPLPPLEVQQAIVAEIEAEQALVAANRELIERFEKKIRAAIERVWGEDNTEEKRS